jgi:hypothetical protein
MLAWRRPLGHGAASVPPGLSGLHGAVIVDQTARNRSSSLDVARQSGREWQATRTQTDVFTAYIRRNPFPWL